MAQHDYSIANQDGASFRADINDVLTAIATCNSGATAPGVTFPHQVWHDTATSTIKQRDSTNSSWLNLADVLLAGKTVTGNVTVNGLLTYTNSLKSETAKATTSGTAVEFTGIPSWVKRITLMLNGVSTNGTSSALVQLGSTTYTSTGYLGSSNIIGTAGAVTNLSTGFRIFFNTSDAAAAVRHGTITLCNVTGNTWVASGTFGLSDSAWISTIGGTVALGGVLDRIRLTTVNGTDAFDAGSINILYE